MAEMEEELNDIEFEESSSDSAADVVAEGEVEESQAEPAGTVVTDPAAKQPGTVAAGNGGEQEAGGGLQAPKGMLAADRWNASQTDQNTVSTGKETSFSQGTTESTKFLQDDLFAQLKEAMGPDMGVNNAATMISALTDGEAKTPEDAIKWLQEERDRKKQDADRRRRRHEGVEAVRLMIEAATGGLHGRVVKRDKVNYQRYQDDKDKADAAYKAALDKLYGAISKDADNRRSMLANLLGMSIGSRQTSERKGESERKNESNTKSNTTSMGHTPRVSGGTTVINTGSGGDNRKDWRSFSVPTEKRLPDGTIEKGMKNVRFAGGENQYKSALTNIANAILRDKSGELFKRAKAVMREQGLDFGSDDNIYKQVLTGAYRNEGLYTDNAREQAIVAMITTNPMLWSIAVQHGFTEDGETPAVNKNNLKNQSDARFSKEDSGGAWD